MPALLLLATALAADCLAPAGAGDLEAALGVAEAGYAELDSAAFQQGLDEAALIVPCLDAVVSGASAARLHRLSGLQAYGLGDEEAALAAFTAGRAAEPAYRFPYELVPPGHALHGLFETAMLQQAEAEALPEPLGVVLVLDGVEASGWRPTLPVVFQVVDDEVVVGSTWWLPGRDLPDYPQLRPPPPPLEPTPEPATSEARRSGPALGLVAGGAAAAAVGVGLAGWQAWQGSLYYNNCLTAKSIGSGGTCRNLLADYERAETRYAVGLGLGAAGVTTAGTGLLLSALGAL